MWSASLVSPKLLEHQLHVERLIVVLDINILVRVPRRRGQNDNFARRIVSDMRKFILNLVKTAFRPEVVPSLGPGDNKGWPMDSDARVDDQA